MLRRLARLVCVGLFKEHPKSMTGSVGEIRNRLFTLLLWRWGGGFVSEVVQTLLQRLKLQNLRHRQVRIRAVESRRIDLVLLDVLSKPAGEARHERDPEDSGGPRRRRGRFSRLAAADGNRTLA